MTEVTIQSNPEPRRYAPCELELGEIVSRADAYEAILTDPAMLRLVTTEGLIILDEGTLAVERDSDDPNYWRLPKGSVINLKV
jgi:hypothetical protein